MTDVAADPKRGRVATASRTAGHSRVWDAASGAAVSTLAGDGGLDAVALDPTGRRLVAVPDGPGDVARVFDPDTGTETARLKGHVGRVRAVAFSPDGDRVVTGGGDNTARVWDAATGVQLVLLEGHTGDVNAVAFDPAGGRVATASTDGTARVYDARTGATLVSMEGSPGR